MAHLFVEQICTLGRQSASAENAVGVLERVGALKSTWLDAWKNWRLAPNSVTWWLLAGVSVKGHVGGNVGGPGRSEVNDE